MRGTGCKSPGCCFSIKFTELAQRFPYCSIYSWITHSPVCQICYGAQFLLKFTKDKALKWSNLFVKRGGWLNNIHEFNLPSGIHVVSNDSSTESVDWLSVCFGRGRSWVSPGSVRSEDLNRGRFGFVTWHPALVLWLTDFYHQYNGFGEAADLPLVSCHGEAALDKRAGDIHSATRRHIILTCTCSCKDSFVVIRLKNCEVWC